MAYQRKTESKKKEYKAIADGISVVGTEDRFSMNFHGMKIHGCKIIDGQKGAFIAFPAWKCKKDDKWHSYVGFDQNIINEELADEITGKVIEALE